MSISKQRDLFPTNLSRLCSIAFQLQRWKHTSPGENDGHVPAEVEAGTTVKAGLCNPSIWRAYDSKKVGIDKSAISGPAWTIIRSLQGKGFEAYLVGGCVRDLLLKRVPKDFDVITTATNIQIKKQFRRCFIVGRRFPICQVYMVGSITEVSSFHTTGINVKESKEGISRKAMRICSEKDLVLWKDSMRRDFTINGLFFDPVKAKVYDYVNGLQDLKSSKAVNCCRVILEPCNGTSWFGTEKLACFNETGIYCGFCRPIIQRRLRILRGLRIAARLGFRFSDETAAALNELSSSICTLNKARLLMELDFMLAYGAARPSIQLLRKYGLLEILLPFHAAYLNHQSKHRSDYTSTMFMNMFSSLDKLVFTDQPCSCTLWLGLLAFHIALVQNPQEASVVWAFSSLLYFGTCSDAMDIVKRMDGNEKAVDFLPEIRAPCDAEPMSEKMLKKKMLDLATLVRSSVNVFSSVESLRENLTVFSDAPEFSGQELISAKKGHEVARLFNLECNKRRERYDINYGLLKKGDPDETRFVIGKVILDTLTAGMTKSKEKEVRKEDSSDSIRNLRLLFSG